MENELAEKHCLECESNPPYFDETHCLDRYDGRLRSALHQLKYQGRLACAHGLATAWNQLMADDLKSVRANYLLPVPLSQVKLCTRGFNQSWELARRIRCTNQINKNPHILLRHHHTQHQANENRINRHLAIREMFYINPKYERLLDSATVIVFDDVMTSGATLNEIARVLKDNGVSRVINWALLRALRPTHRS
jgi:ComF family protein